MFNPLSSHIEKPSFSFRRLAYTFMVAIAFFQAGCSSRSPYSNYGNSDAESKESPDGFSAFRGLCDDSSRRTFEVSNLSPGLMGRVNTLVWIPKSFTSPEPKTIQWIEDWMEQGGKTLVLVGRDYSPMEDYWEECRKIALGENRLMASKEFELSRLKERTKLEEMRRGVRPDLVTPWGIYQSGSLGWESVTSVTGPLSHAKERISLQSGDTDSPLINRSAESSTISAEVRNGTPPLRIRVRMHFQSWDQIDLKEWHKKLDWQPSTSTASAAASPAKPVGENMADQWDSKDEQSLQIVTSQLSSSPYVSSTLLASESGTPLLTSVHLNGFETANGGGSSQIILVANSSIMSNFNLTAAGNREICRNWIETLPSGRVGFISGTADPRVLSESEASQQKGFEALTMWPLNVITIHASLLGVITLIALFPIIGRPRRMISASNRSFSLHIEALAKLLQRTRDTYYAQATIADYFRNVRKDPNSPWVTDATLATSQSKSPFANPLPEQENSISTNQSTTMSATDAETGHQNASGSN